MASLRTELSSKSSAVTKFTVKSSLTQQAKQLAPESLILSPTSPKKHYLKTLDSKVKHVLDTMYS